MSHDDSSFSMSTMLNALHDLPFVTAREPITEVYPTTSPPNPRGISVVIPSPGFTPSPPPFTNSFFAALTHQELDMRLQWMFNVMTNSEEDAAAFKEIISKLNRRDLHRTASLLTSDPDYFLEIARIKNGSKRLKKLIGKSDDVDTLFADAILRRFLHIMTDKFASHVAIRGISVFDKEKKEVMYDHILHYALDIACDKYGCLALNVIITDEDDTYYRNQIFDIVTHNALFLSKDPCGNYVIQHALKLNNLHCTYNIAVSLRGHCVDLSFRKHGSYIVEQLLEMEVSMVVVVEEFLECEGDRLMRLARSEFGNFVVCKALRVTQKEMIWTDLFWGLVHKLKPKLPFLRRSRNIASILESIC